MKKFILFTYLIFAVFVAAQPSIAAVAIDATGTSQGTTTNTPITTFNYTGITVGAGSNRALIIVVTINDSTLSPPTGVSATWDSGVTNQAMTLLVSNADVPDNNNPVFIFGLRNPASGNKTLNISWTNSNTIALNAISFTGVDQTSDGTAFPHTATSNNAGGALSIAVTSAVGNWTIAGIAGGVSSTPNHTIWLNSLTDAGGTLYTDGDNVFAQQATGAATVTFTDTMTFPLAAAAVDIAASGGAAAATTRRALTGVGN